MGDSMSKIEVDSITNQSGDQDSGINLGTNDTVKFDIAGSTKWTLNSSGNLFPSSTSQGICFGVTSDTASNRLDDYEEGTWTPTDQSGGSLSMTVWVATYTKHGFSGNGALIKISDGQNFNYLEKIDIGNTYNLKMTLARGRKDKINWGYDTN
mgnify:CR=1 FL=1